MSETQFRNPCHTHRDIESLAGRKLYPDFNCGIKKKKTQTLIQSLLQTSSNLALSSDVCYDITARHK